MQLRIIRAESMAVALRTVRTELGAGALILSSRRTRDGVELTAACEPPADKSLPSILEPIRLAPSMPHNGTAPCCPRRAPFTSWQPKAILSPGLLSSRFRWTRASHRSFLSGRQAQARHLPPPNSRRVFAWRGTVRW